MTTFRINISEFNEHTLAILQLLKTDKSIEVIEETTDLYREKLIAQAIKAEEAYKNGDVLTTKELREKSKQW